MPLVLVPRPKLFPTFVLDERLSALPLERVDHAVHAGDVDDDVEVAVVDEHLDAAVLEDAVEPLGLAHHDALVEVGVAVVPLGGDSIALKNRLKICLKSLLKVPFLEKYV